MSIISNVRNVPLMNEAEINFIFSFQISNDIKAVTNQTKGMTFREDHFLTTIRTNKRTNGNIAAKVGIKRTIYHPFYLENLVIIGFVC